MFPKRSSSVSSSSGIAVVEGVLEKKKTIGSGRFYCSLRDGKLWYSEDKARESLIDIAHAQSIREGKAKFSFEIITSSRTHVFIADSQATRDKWISGLREVMRMSLRKMSTNSYVAPDDDNQSIASRSSLALRSSSASLKPGFTTTLPASLVTRTPAKSSENEHELRKSSNTDAAPKLGSPNEIEHGPKALGMAPVSETSELRALLRRRDEKNNTEKINNLASEVKVERESLDSDVNDYETVIQTDFQAKQFVAASQNDDDNDHNGSSSTLKVDKEDCLYANRADIEKFLNEQRSATEGTRPGSSDMSNSKISEFSAQSESQKSNSAEVETTTGISESTEARDSADENSDEVFPLTGQTQKVESSSGPVMRRSTRSTPSIEVDYVVPEPVEVELDLDFASGPIPSLPHPRLEEKWSSAFLDIRSMLSDRAKDDSFTSSVKPGCAIEALKSFLNSLDSINRI